MAPSTTTCMNFHWRPILTRWAAPRMALARPTLVLVLVLVLVPVLVLVLVPVLVPRPPQKPSKVTQKGQNPVMKLPPQHRDEAVLCPASQANLASRASRASRKPRRRRRRKLRKRRGRRQSRSGVKSGVE